MLHIKILNTNIFCVQTQLESFEFIRIGEKLWKYLHYFKKLKYRIKTEYRVLFRNFSIKRSAFLTVLKINPRNSRSGSKLTSPIRMKSFF